LTPNQRHQGRSEEICEKRKQIYEAAKAKHPSRWSRQIRNWDLDKKVWLNPEKDGVIDADEEQIK
jgi:putative transposase